MFRFQWRPRRSGFKWPRILLWTTGPHTNTCWLLQVKCWLLVWGFTFPPPHVSNQEPHVFSLSEGQYICHSYCRDLVHLDYPQNGKLPSCMPARQIRHSSKKNTQVGTVGWHSGFGSTVSHVPGNGLFTPPPQGLPEYLHRLLCSFSAISPVLRARPIRSLTVGCDIRNTPIEWFDGSSNRFGIRSDGGFHVHNCLSSLCGLVGKRPHCRWKQDVKWECVCQLCLHDKEPQHACPAGGSISCHGFHPSHDL